MSAAVGHPRSAPAATGVPRRRRWRPVTTLLVLVLLTPVAVTARIIQLAASDTHPPADAIVVLGAAANGGRPSAVLEARLDRARQLYQAGVAPRIITVGGTGAGQPVSEGEAGARWLLDHGVPAPAVVAIGSGRNTLTSLQAVAAQAPDGSWGSLIIVTDPWHLYRSQAMAHDVGLDVVGTSPAVAGPNVERRRFIAYNIVRETAAFIAYRGHTLLDRAGAALDRAVTTGQ